jgi:conjugal transfer pilus assembly protein TraV
MRSFTTSAPRLPWLPLLVIAPLAAGCSAAIPGSSKFSCQADAPNGICAPAREIYRQTDDRARTRAQAPAVTAPEATAQPLPLVATGTASHPSTSPDAIVPVRAAPAVLRVWVAPHETNSGDLHAASFVFTELASRRWTGGGGAFAGSGPAVLRPLDPNAPALPAPPAGIGGWPRGGGAPGGFEPVPNFQPRQELQAGARRGEELDDGDAPTGFFGPRPPVQAASVDRRPVQQASPGFR